MKYDLTVLVPGIRPYNWEKLYNSVKESTKKTWEIIFIGPYDLPEALNDKDNIQYIQDWGSPIRCQQIGLTKAQGDWITWAADDGVFLPDMLDRGFELLARQEMNPMCVIMGKYLEGDASCEHMKNNEYYILNNHDASNLKYVPENCYMLNVGIVSKELLFKIGGWDCQFEVCPMAYNDLAIRLRRYNVDFVIQDKVMYTCSHLPGREGDHGPIHDGQIKKDQPLFKRIYEANASRGRDVIQLDNWKKAPDVWTRRFNGREGK